MIELITIVELYVALVVVIILHELGHFPKSIKFKFFPIPKAAAMQSDPMFRLGGLIVNALIFIGIWYYRPEQVILQYIGLISWLHFVIYLILGSIIPEPKESQVDIRTYVFDDVDNKYALIFITIAIIAFMKFESYFIPIMQGIMN